MIQNNRWRLLLVGVSVFSIGAAADTTKARPTWQRLARCAAAYRANAQISDPGRSASMKRMQADAADDYEAAAVMAYPRTLKATAERGLEIVEAYVAVHTQQFSQQPRTRIEHFIDACPQPSD